MANTIDTSMHSVRGADQFGAFRSILALCHEVLAGTPAKLREIRRVTAQSDAALAKVGQNRDVEIRRVFSDWFRF